MILGYILADSGGTPIITREYIPILTKEGRNFFAQISAVMYSFVEGLVHSRLRHVETESIHLYFASTENLIFTLFSDIEDPELESIAERIALEIERLGFDPIQLQIDESIKKEVMDLIDRYLRTPPPDINLIKEIIGKMKGLLGHGKITKLDLTPPPIRTRKISLKDIKLKKTALQDFKALLDYVVNLNYKDILAKTFAFFNENYYSNAAKTIFVKTALLMMESSSSEIINPDELKSLIKEISDVFIQMLLEYSLAEFYNISSYNTKSKLILTNKTIIKSNIARDLEESVAYILATFPPIDNELARIYAEILPKGSLLHTLNKSYEVMYKFIYGYELPSDEWLYYLGELQQETLRSFDKKSFDHATSWLRAWVTILSISHLQKGISLEEVSEILKVFEKSWKKWRTCLDKSEKIPITIKVETYLRYLEILKILSIATGKDYLSNQLKEIIQWIRALGKYKLSERIPMIKYTILMSELLGFVAEILARRGEMSPEIINMLEEIIGEDIWILWTLSPTEFSLYYSNLLWTLTQIADTIRLKTIRRDLLEQIIQEFENIREVLKGYPVIYWSVTLKLIEALAILGVDESLEKIDEMRQEAEKENLLAFNELVERILKRHESAETH
ncbi:MAG: hypothetical protein ACTSX9_10040 [Candidatus Njordarchaeales archaeon]